ncbi:MAG TPA: DUF1513 domain-containing protein [Devosiaceae bacterium]|nr:DUF1513 domain-containing protein [Devosiaceae bacterium]
MAIERRRLLALTAAFGLAPCLPVAASQPGGLYLSARADRRRPGAFAFSGLDAAGSRLFDIPLPGRGHSVAVHPRAPLAVVFARRPGRFAVVVDWRRGQIAARIAPPDDRHFYGHGVFSGDGRLLYACENDFENRRGVIGIYATGRRFARVGEFPSFGIGPHDIHLLPDGVTLAVANGGIATHPDLRRVKLNIPTMAPSLVLLDRRDGGFEKKLQLAPSLHKASIRHLAQARAGRLVAAMQYEGPAGDLVPLIAVSEHGGPLRVFDKPAAAIRALRQYCGSVAFDRAGAMIAASSPRGGVLTFWEADTGAHLFTTEIADVCGVAAAGGAGRFLASSGRGDLFHVDVRGKRVARIGPPSAGGTAWDNHLVAVDLPR